MRKKAGGIEVVSVKKKPWYKDRQFLQLLSMISIPTLLVFVFSYIPMAGIIIAFKNYKYNLGIFGSEWVGFKNFNYEYMPEFPGRCGLTFEESCIDAEFSDGVRDTRLKYDSYKIEEGDNTKALKILLKDEYYPLEVELLWQYTKRDRKAAVVFAFGNGLNWKERIPPLKLRGLEPDTKYEVTGIGTFSGDTLMKFGIEIELFGDYASKVIKIKAV